MNNRNYISSIITSPDASIYIRNNIKELSRFVPVLETMVGFDQRSPYHDRDLFEHTLAVLDGIPVLPETGFRDEALSYAALLHDSGKPEAFFIDDKGVGHMYHHAEYSVRIAGNILRDFGFPQKEFDEILSLIRYHDYFPDPTVESVSKFMKYADNEFLDKLFMLQRADILAHSELGQKRLLILDEICSIRDGLI